MHLSEVQLSEVQLSKVQLSEVQLSEVHLFEVYSSYCLRLQYMPNMKLHLIYYDKLNYLMYP